jgi:predicted enzyme related to lactoylglutathione lyase
MNFANFNRLGHGLFLAFSVLVSAGCSADQMVATEPMSTGTFSSSTIDFGIVVNDMDKMAKFYTDVVGMKQVGTFTAKPELAGGIGLTDNKGANVRIFATDDGKGSTKLKLLKIPGAKPAKGNNAFIHSTLGMSYTTFFVKDLDASEKRMADAGVKALGKSPMLLPDGKQYILTLRDPEGNFVELIGPKAAK